MNIKGAIFDMDGTLLNSMEMYNNLADDFLIKCGCVPEKNLRQKIKPMTFIQCAEYMIKEYNLPYNIDYVLNSIYSIIPNKYKYEVTLKDGVLELLKEFKNQGVKMCVATATDRVYAISAFERLDILKYFDGIVACSEVGNSKEKPDVYYKSLELIKTDINETVVFEDAYHAVYTAKKSGFKVVGVYDKSAEKESEMIKSLADVYCDNLLQWQEKRDLL